MNWISKYVGIPFLDKGRSFKGCDCWGLVYLIYKHELNIELPEYGEISAEDLASVAKMVEANHTADPWVPVGNPAQFDVLVMKFYGSKRTGHVGVITDDGCVLHTEKGYDSAIVPLNHMTIRQRIVCVCRHKDRINAARSL